jgi:hypothetical protein
VDAPPWRGSHAPEQILKLAPVRRQVGQGRVAYIPEVKPSVAKPPAARMTSQYWKLPLNWRELVDAVQWAASGRLSLEVTAPTTVVTELVEQKEKDKMIVHLLNYNVAKNPSVGNIGVNLRIPEERKAVKVSLISPDEDGTSSLSYVRKNGGVSFTVPRLKTYSLAVVQLEHAK